MLKLVLLAAALAAVTASPIYTPYMNPYFPSPYGILPYGYPGAIPYVRAGLPGIHTPFLGADPYASVAGAEDQEPLLPFASAPTKLFLSPEQHHIYQEALKSHDPLGYFEKINAEGKKNSEEQYKH